VNYPSIRIEGAILSPDIIDRLDDMPGQRPADFGFESGTKVKDEIARAWADAQDYWRIFQRKLETLKPDASAATETRNNWIVPLLSLLKYDLEYQKQGAELNGKIYAISHRVTNRGQTPVHIVGYRDPAGLDRKPANATLRMSAHAMVQEYLNLTEQLYGVVTNGRVIRLLRDSSRLIKQSYLEFDLDRIFTDGLFADFAVMYRLLHATRLPVSSEAASDSLIEKLHQDSLDSGARIREGLSKAVEEAILAFGNGFLAHPANTQLRERVASGQLAPDQYYASLLRLIYRLLFLMVIEERGLVFPPKATQAQRETYLRYYSVQRLRALAEKRYLADKRQSDLWLALLSTFCLFEADGPGEKLGLKPLAGDLFRPDAIGELDVSQLSNEALLNCLRSLGLYEHPQNKQLIRVNYAALNVEEFGSVYEGLLEYEPVIESAGSVPAFAFKQGDGRSATGSHYTPDDLVQPLIKHSLDHLIAERLKEKDPAAALLELRVADIACGSGHILLAAARRIATELAVVRTGEEQPSPSAYRTALRDVIRTCIYGVDLNPLAVELCKVALWLEAHNPGEPLNFLDHHIKCGNAIVGFVKREEVDNGVPDEAFAKLPGDDPEIGKKVRARNKRERAERNQAKLSFTPARENEIKAVMDRWSSITAMPERTPAEIDAKKQAFEGFSGSGAAWLLKQLASIPIAQFYIPRTEENESRLITDGEFRELWAGNASPQGQAPAAAFALASRKRFFHWFIEFPEIVQRGGFDCILGNPPFLGGKRISGTFGDAFLLWVKMRFAPDKGITDLAAYFFRRSYELLRFGGAFGLISTNTIAQGDTRVTGLEQIRNNGGQIVFAVKSMRWPGLSAAVEVALVAVYKGDWLGSRWLGSSMVSGISTFLDTDSSSSGPAALGANKERAFIGSIILGNGFLSEVSSAIRLIEEHPGLGRVLKPYLTGADLNGNPRQAPSRFVIDFGDLSLDEARKFSPLFEQVEREVRPQRAAVKREIYRDNWWRFAERCPGLYRKIASLNRVLVVAQVSQTVAFAFVRNDQVFSAKTIVFAMDKWADFAQLQSTLHNIWAWKYCTTMKSDLSYGPTAIFQTFPMLSGHDLEALEPHGERYHEHRRILMLRLWLGLTDVYNLFHSNELEADLQKHFATRAKKDPQGLAIPEEHRAAALKFTYDEALAGILDLRRLHVELDNAVLAAYGWNVEGEDGPAVVLAHDFYEVETLPENDRTRYTISPAARKELLARLLKENHRRAAAEAASAPVDSKKPAGKSRGKKKSGSDDEGLFA
jgi:hypothetical protein